MIYFLFRLINKVQLGDPSIRHSSDNLRSASEYSSEFFKAPTTSTMTTTTIVDDAEHDLLLLRPPMERWMGEQQLRQQVTDEDANEKR